MKNKLRFGIGVLGLSALLVGCQGNEMEQQVAEAQEEVAMTDISPMLEISERKLRLVGSSSNGLYYVTGAITNNTGEDVSEVIELVFSDEAGDVIRVRPFRLDVKAGDTIYFDELSGMTTETNKPAFVKIAPLYK